MKILSLLLAVTLLAGTATAGDKGKHDGERVWEKLLKKFDKNGDGAISKDEIDQVRAEEKAAHAAKKNEQPAPPAPPATPRPEGKKHAPHPGVHLYKDFDKIDTNKDGKITQDEFKAAWEAAREAAKAATPDAPKAPETPKAPDSK